MADGEPCKYREGQDLFRHAGITVPILVMGGIIGNQIPVFLRHGLTLAASSIDKLSDIARGRS